MRDVNGDSYGIVALSRSSFADGEVLIRTRGFSLRVVRVVRPAADDERFMPVLVVERTD